MRRLSMNSFSYNPIWKQSIPLSKDIMNIILLAHVQEPRGHVNKMQLQCNETERFSIEEFNEIYQGIVSAGYFIQAVYYNELDFISDYIQHAEYFENSIIYNLARNGYGDNKKTFIPAFCELTGLNYTCSSSLSCAFSRNKYYFTNLFRTHGIPSPESWMLTANGEWLTTPPPSGLKVICKPCSESASQGINESKIFTVTPDAFQDLIGTQYIIQEYIDGEECEVPVFKFRNCVSALSPVGIELNGKCILDEKASAENNYGFYSLMDTQSSNTINKIKFFAEKAFRLIHMDVYGRIDFRIDSKGIPYVFDISTTPYTTRHSSFAYDFEKMGLQYKDIYETIISCALSRGNFEILK